LSSRSFEQVTYAVACTSPYIATALLAWPLLLPPVVPAVLQDLAAFAAEIAAYHAAQIPIAADAAQRAKQQAREAQEARDAGGGADSE
jgi:hypothetical protein